MNLAFRLAYRLAYRMLQVWWFVRRPRAHGAAVALWQDDALLLVRTSYRRELDLPGGGIGRGEEPVVAAARELREETGLDAAPAEFADLGEFRFVDNRRQITAYLYAWRSAARVSPIVDRREIVWAGFVPRAKLEEENLGRLPRLYLEELNRQVSSGTRVRP